MKNYKTDSEISALIKQALDSHQQDYIPGSWENFLLTQKKKRKALVLRIVSSIAACLIVGFLGFNFFRTTLHEEFSNSSQPVANIVQPVPTEKKPAAKNFTPSVLPITQPTKQVASAVINPVSATGSSKRPTALLERTVSNPTQAMEILPDTTSERRVLTAEEKRVLTADAKTKSAINTADSVGKAADSVLHKTDILVANSLNTNADKKIASAQKRKIRFGINFSPGVNTTQSASAINYQGGISADIDLFANFQLSTGLQLENQNIVNNEQGLATSMVTSSNQLKTKLLNLDIPVNLTWKFLSEKSNSFYVSAGLSSLVYLKQDNKNTTYSQMMVPMSSAIAGDAIKTYSYVDQVSVVQNTVTPDRVFDFAGRVNLIFGIETKLTPRLFLHLEPYAKIPVTGMAVENLKHTSTGINFKISF